MNVENAVIDGGKLVYKYNQEARYSCKEGYRGRPTRTCKENGWDGNSQCEGKKVQKNKFTVDMFFCFSLFIRSWTNLSNTLTHT